MKAWFGPEKADVKLLAATLVEMFELKNKVIALLLLVAMPLLLVASCS